VKKTVKNAILPQDLNCVQEVTGSIPGGYGVFLQFFGVLLNFCPFLGRICETFGNESCFSTYAGANGAIGRSRHNARKAKLRINPFGNRSVSRKKMLIL
jgi:hypothetical protein